MRLWIPRIINFAEESFPAAIHTHVLDGLLNKIARQDIFFFRRLNHSDRYPICSWITAYAYDRVLHYRFGVPPECADPDQMYDWVKAHPREWTLIFRYSTRMLAAQ